MKIFLQLAGSEVLYCILYFSVVPKAKIGGDSRRRMRILALRSE